ncbi:conjugal transfer protein TraW [Paraburkholderia sp. BCC1885]|uniref:conjugal transfer protein TraW n=1 Tax=Paraburkholderia sp. BCC1885 TaxID=2562669 RepID=UPI0011823BFC|nr:conjugal transfer protein TraW [Paraburkholderia sp. BCC1885]
MTKKLVSWFLVLCGALTLSTTTNAYADCDGCVVASVQAAAQEITTAIGSLGSTLLNELTEIDGDIGGIGAKQAATSAMAANTQRDMAAQVQQQSEIDATLQQTELPLDPCATSGSNYAMQAVHSVNMTASNYRPGGNATVSSAPLSKALGSVAPSIEASRRATTSIHEAAYCNANEVALGYPGCSSSSMPDGDANADSLYTGAGMPGKDVDLTFTPQEIEAARAYERMSVDPEPPQYVTKAEANTEVGKLYIAMQKAYQANVSSAENTLNTLIAARAPFPGSAQLISDINASSDSAEQYYNANASPVAKSTGTMSLAELEEFEAGRRWRNPYWQIEMGAVADPTKLAREQLYTTAFMADITYQNFQRSQHIEVLLGQLLAMLERTSERPGLDAQLQRVHATNAK